MKISLLLEGDSSIVIITLNYDDLFKIIRIWGKLYLSLFLFL